MRMQIRALAALFLVFLAFSAASFSTGELVLLSLAGLGLFALAGVVEDRLNQSLLVRR